MAISLSRTDMPAQRHFLHPGGYAWVALAIATIAVAAIPAMLGTMSWEVELQRNIQETSPGAGRAVADFMTLIGNSPVYPLMAFAAAGTFFTMRHRSLAALVVAAMALRTLSPAMKAVFDRDRPAEGGLIDVAERLSSSSFPSGHVFGATLLFGCLIYALEHACAPMLLRRVLQGILLTLIVLMGYARVELGEHWPTDVIAGWAVGFLMVWGLAKVHFAFAHANNGDAHCAD